MLKWHQAGMLVIPFSLTACGSAPPIETESASVATVENVVQGGYGYVPQPSNAQRQQQLRQKLAYQKQQATARAKQQQAAAAQQRQQQIQRSQRAQPRYTPPQARRPAPTQVAMHRSQRRTTPVQRPAPRHQPQHRPAPTRQVALNRVPAAAGVRPYHASAKIYRGGGKSGRLPDAVASKLKLRGLNPSRMTAYARNVRGGQALLTANADRAATPASTMKLVTTYAALGILGPNYRWPTELYTTGNIANGTLYGDVVIKGYGDPDFREKDLRNLLQQLRARGVRHIQGNLIADNTYFRLGNRDPGAFDGKRYAAYNALPEALLYNERSSCYEFKNLKGQIQKVCPLPQNRRARADLNTNLFGGFWKLWKGQMGGEMSGQFLNRPKPANARLVYRHHSKPLSQVIHRINKKSNNVMARQLLLSIGAKQKGAPGTERKGATAIGQWLSSRGLHFPELRIENGSGLSRVAKISSRHLGEMLIDAYNSPYRNHFIQSLAVVGRDGTVRNRLKRSPVRGRAQMKTGTLRNVRAIAGYVQAADGQTYALSILHNDPKARSKARSAHDDLIEWTFNGGRQGYAKR